MKWFKTRLTGMFYTTSLMHVVNKHHIQIEYDYNTSTVRSALNHIVMVFGQL
jgi:hypothetical protein